MVILLLDLFWEPLEFWPVHFRSMKFWKLFFRFAITSLKYAELRFWRDLLVKIPDAFFYAEICCLFTVTVKQTNSIRLFLNDGSRLLTALCSRITLSVPSPPVFKYCFNKYTGNFQFFKNLWNSIKMSKCKFSWEIK